jgi:hypothetical protein
MATDNNDWRKPALAEYLERRSFKIKEISEARANAERFATITKARESELADLDKAAAVLGISNPPRPQDGIAANISATANIRASVTVTDGDGEEVRGGFKEQAVEALRKSYPNPLRAAEVQKAVERKLLRQFHEKTAGMTLFRLSKDGVVRRSGWDWYFVPENDRKPHDVGGDEPINLRDADEFAHDADGDAMNP